MRLSVIDLSRLRLDYDRGVTLVDTTRGRSSCTRNATRCAYDCGGVNCESDSHFVVRLHKSVHPDWRKCNAKVRKIIHIYKFCRPSAQFLASF